MPLNQKWKETFVYEFSCGIFCWSKTEFKGYSLIYCLWIISTRSGKFTDKSCNEVYAFTWTNANEIYTIWGRALYSHDLWILPVDNYIVFYLPDETDTTVSAIRIMYGGRDIDKQLNDN